MRLISSLLTLSFSTSANVGTDAKVNTLCGSTQIRTIRRTTRLTIKSDTLSSKKMMMTLMPRKNA